MKCHDSASIAYAEAAPAMKYEPGPPMTLGNAGAARVQVEPDLRRWRSATAPKQPSSIGANASSAPGARDVRSRHREDRCSGGVVIRGDGCTV
jgi:hypothetical protein